MKAILIAGRNIINFFKGVMVWEPCDTKPSAKAMIGGGSGIAILI